MKESLQNFYLFLKKPSLIKQSKDRSQLMADLSSLYLVYFVFTALLFSVFGLLLHFKIIKEYEEIDILKKYGVLGTILFACLLAPFFEELIFRYHLRKLKATIYFFFISIAVMMSFLASSEIVQFAIVAAALIIAALTIDLLKKKGKIYTLKVWKKCYPFQFYYTAVVFGLIHLGNHKGLTVCDPSFVFYIASQTVGGLGLGYLRIKYGLVYSMLFHAFFNLVWVLFAILFP